MGERVRGKKFNRALPDFGERVHYLTLRSRGSYKAESRCKTQIFLGVREESGEYKIGTEDGMTRGKVENFVGAGGMPPHRTKQLTTSNVN